jgi:hypothetical protein
MTLDEVREQVSATTAADWQLLDGGVVPVYLDRFSQISSGDQTWLEHDSHHSRAVLRDDIAIGLAWGLRENKSFAEDWTTRFPNPRASTAWLEVLYHGQPVDRELIVHVDGRCYVPLPEQVFDDVRADRPKVTALRISRWQYEVVGRAQELGGGTYDYDEYVRQCGFEVIG